MMRYLLIFHSDFAGQWRCLDSARLGRFTSGQAADLPGALNEARGLALGWMLGRRVFGPLCRAADAAAEGVEWIRVHALDTGQAVIGLGNEYHGAWLEMFMQQSEPLGWIAAQRPAAARSAGALAALEARAGDPLRATDEACRQTMEQMRTQQDAAREQRRPKVAAQST